MRTWVEYAIVFWILLGTYVSISTIGKERKPLTGSVVAFATMLNLMLIAGVIYLAH